MSVQNDIAFSQAIHRQLLSLYRSLNRTDIQESTPTQKEQGAIDYIAHIGTDTIYLIERGRRVQYRNYNDITLRYQRLTEDTEWDKLQFVINNSPVPIWYVYYKQNSTITIANLRNLFDAIEHSGLTYRLKQNHDHSSTFAIFRIDDLYHYNCIVHIT